MKKLIKKGMGMLATTACALTFAYAQPGEKQAEPYTMEKTVEIYQQYYEKLSEAAVTMKKITRKEVQELDNFLQKHLPYIQKHSPKDVKDYLMSEDGEKYTYLIKKESKITKIEEVIRTLEEKILCLYPGLVNDEKTNITYEYDDDIERRHKEVLRSLVKKVQEIYPDTKNSIVLKRIEDSWPELSDLAAFYFLVEKMQKDKPNLEKEEEIKKIKIKIANLSEHKKAFEDYLKGYEDFQDWHTKWISGNVIAYAIDHHINNSAKTKLKEKISSPIQTEYSIEDYSETELETKLPLWAWIPISTFGVILFKLFIAAYTKRRLDDIDGVHSVASPLLGLCFFDVIHPWAMPVRVLALPIIEEILAKKERHKK